MCIRDRAKAARNANKPAPAAKKAAATNPEYEGLSEEEIEKREAAHYHDRRLAEVTKQVEAHRKDLSLPSPYPHKFNVSHTFKQFYAQFEHLKAGEELPDVKVSVASRIAQLRAHGNLYFFEMYESTFKLQLMCRSQSYYDGAKFKEEVSSFHLGDIVGLSLIHI